MRRARELSLLGARAMWMRRQNGFVDQKRGAKPRLLVDVSVIVRHDAQTGIQRVVRAIWSELRSLQEPHFELVPVHASKAHGYCYAPVDFLEKRNGVLSREAVRARGTDVFLGLDLSLQFLPMYGSQVEAWRRVGAKICLIVYDLLPILTPEFFSSPTVSYFRRWWQFLGSEADQAICISKQVSRDVRERLQIDGVRGPEVCCLELGGDILASRPTLGMCDNVSQLLDRMRFRPTVLMVGTIEPRKGYDVALNAFEHLWATRGGEAPDLVIVGKPGWKTESLQRRIRIHPEQGRRLQWLDQVSDESLCSLYESSRGLLMASHAEGFGLPLLEAAMHRRHVLARDLAVFREQNLPNVFFFQDDRPSELGVSIIDLVSAGSTRPPHLPELPTWSQSVEDLLIKLGLNAARVSAMQNELTSRAARANSL